MGSARPLRPDDPDRVGAYTILGRIGEGGMGAVFLAQDADGRKVAVKVVRPELARDAGFIARFQDEVANAQRVASFCTAQVLDHGESDGHSYMVTEYIDGVSLRQYIDQNGELSPGMVQGVSVGVAAALVAIHSAGLIHRDLKPANVMLSFSGPRVIDFGIARALDAASGHTMTGQLVGSPGWMAPEQIRGEATTTAVDIFAWGCLVAYARTGINPFGRGDFSIMAARVIHADPQIGNLQAPLDRLVRAALDKDPRNRPTAKELLLTIVGGESAEAAVMGTLVPAWQPPVPSPSDGSTRQLTEPHAVPEPGPEPRHEPRHEPRPPAEPRRSAESGPHGERRTYGGTLPLAGQAPQPVPPGYPDPGGAATPRPPVPSPSGPPAGRGPADGPGPALFPHDPRRPQPVYGAVPPDHPQTPSGIRQAATTPPGPSSATGPVTSPVGAPPPLQPGPSAGSGRNRQGVVYVAAAVALVAATVAGWVLIRPGDGAKPKPTAAVDPLALPKDPMLVRVDRQEGWPDNCHANIGELVPGAARPKLLSDDPSKCDVLPQWSHDHKRIAFTRKAGKLYELWVMNADGSNAQLINELLPNLGRSAWSPDDTKLAVMGVNAGVTQIYIIPVANPEGATQLTTDSSKKDDPAWCGDRIAFWGRQSGGTQQIYTIDANKPGSSLTQVTADNDDANDPAWSPDCKKIAYTEGARQNKHILVINADGSMTGRQQLTQPGNYDMDPNWSHTGTWIAFVRGTTQDPRIWAMRADGRDARQIAPDKWDIAHPDWW
jgi:serine/threonine protein kinase